MGRASDWRRLGALVTDRPEVPGATASPGSLQQRPRTPRARPHAQHPGPLRSSPTAARGERVHHLRPPQPASHAWTRPRTGASVCRPNHQPGIHRGRRPRGIQETCWPWGTAPRCPKIKAFSSVQSTKQENADIRETSGNLIPGDVWYNGLFRKTEAFLDNGRQTG